MQVEPSAVPVSVLDLPDLAPGVVEVWTAYIGVGASGPQVTSEEEQQRSQRFVFDLHRERFIACRSVLRCLLARYAQTPPEDLVFRYSAHGKPELEAPLSRLSFNVSHCEDWALIALTLDDPLGVDIERLRPVEDCLGLANRFFSVAERRVLQALPQSHHEEAFFNCWTRKEAFIKALGEGLSHPLDTFEVSLVPRSPAQLVSVDGVADPQQWCLTGLRLLPNFIGACVVRHRGARVHMAGNIAGWD